MNWIPVHHTWNALTLMLLDGYYFRCFFSSLHTLSSFWSKWWYLIVNHLHYDRWAVSWWNVGAGTFHAIIEFDVYQSNDVVMFFMHDKVICIYFCLASTSVYDANGLWFLQKLLKCCWFLSLPILWLRNNNIHCWRKKTPSKIKQTDILSQHKSEMSSFLKNAQNQVLAVCVQISVHFIFFSVNVAALDDTAHSHNNGYLWFSLIRLRFIFRPLIHALSKQRDKKKYHSVDQFDAIEWLAGRNLISKP